MQPELQGGDGLGRRTSVQKEWREEVDDPLGQIERNTSFQLETLKTLFRNCRAHSMASIAVLMC